MSQAPPLLPATVCQRCGATNPPHATKCWLCERQGVRNPYAPAASLQPIGDASTGMAPFGVAGSAQSRAQNVYASLLVGSAILAVIVGIGLGVQDPGMLVMYLIVIGPAFLATGVSFLYSVSRKERPKPSTLFLVFMSGLFAVIVLALLAVASFVALILWCIWTVSRG